MACGNPGDKNRGEYTSPKGIVTPHAYSILDVKLIGDIRLLKLKNPWADENEWTGDWGDDSEKW